MPSRWIARVDAAQRRHRTLGFPIAVIYKFGDDQGPYLTALITYYGFLSIFPLLLLLVTILGFVLSGDPHLQAKLVDSTVSELPIIGAQLRENVNSLKGSGLALAIGILGTLYGTLGVAGAVQNAFNRAWAVPRNERPNPFALRLRGLLLLVVMGAGVVMTTALSGLTTGAGEFGASINTEVDVGALVLGTLGNVLLFLLVFRVLTAPKISTHSLRTGAVTAGVLWTVVQVLGTYVISHTVKGSSETYGVFGLVLGLIAWIYLLSFVVVMAAEVNVVAVRRLWPRALLTPFTDRVSLTRADEKAYTAYARSERHKGFETVEVDFDPPPDAPPPPEEEIEPG